MPEKAKRKRKPAKTNTVEAETVTISRIGFKMGSSYMTTIQEAEEFDGRGKKGLADCRTLNDRFDGFASKDGEGLFFQREGCDDLFFIHKNTLTALADLVK